MPSNPYAFVFMRPAEGEPPGDIPVIHEECGETVAYVSPGGSTGGILNTINTHACPKEG